MGQAQTRRIGLVALAGLVSVAALVALLWFLASILSNSEKYKDIAELVQTALTILALLAGGAFAAYKFEVFRDSEPRLNLSHTINHRRVGESYVHIDVQVNLHNNSKVLVELRDGISLLLQVDPVSDTEVENLYSGFLAGHNLPEFEWPVLYELERNWDKGEFPIEPGESYNELVEFIVSERIHTVLVQTFYGDPGYVGEERGWSMATVYDIID